MGNEIALSGVEGGKVTKSASAANKREGDATARLNEEIQKILQGSKRDKSVQMQPFMRTLTDEEVEKMKNDGKTGSTKEDALNKKMKEIIENFSNKSIDKGKKMMSPFMRTLTDEDIKRRLEFEEFKKKHPKLFEQIENFGKDIFNKQ